MWSPTARSRTGRKQGRAGGDLNTELTPGARSEVTLQVGDADTAIAHGSGDVPVLATPRLLALCEEAAVMAIAGSLDASATSVGTRVEMEHLAATGVGETVKAVAELAEVDGRRLIFDISVSGAGESPIARGRIHRVVVDRARFLRAR